MSSITAFKTKIKNHNLNITRKNVDIVQVNIGKKCNQACHHCHVESSPIRTEIMDEKTVDRIISLLENSPNVHTVDITGGAPEMNPNFRKLVKSSRALGKKVIDRCNLTILFEKGQEDTANFLRGNDVSIVASLPCYQKSNVEKQRGNGVFNKSIEALKNLNNLGYGYEKNLNLDLVYNPVGIHLPPSQQKLEADYKKELKELFNIEFNNLYTITNMPIKRYLQDLEKQGKLEEYMQLLVDNFNAEAATGVMCTNMISISYDGKIYDCDFNQMLELDKSQDIWAIESFDSYNDESIIFANHCYACTAGSGSSCGGSLV